MKYKVEISAEVHDDSQPAFLMEAFNIAMEHCKVHSYTITDNLGNEDMRGAKK